MHDFSNARIKKLIIHHIGNKPDGELFWMSEQHAKELGEDQHQLMLSYFTNSFKDESYFHFSGGNENVVRNQVSDMFLTAVNFIETSKQLATTLYEVSDHHKITTGEMIVAWFTDVRFNGDEVEALGLFKVGDKTSFLKFDREEERLNLRFDKGNALTKPHKSAIVFAIPGTEDWPLLIHDMNARGEDAQYWREAFLKAEPLSNEYTMTKEYMSMCKSFVMERLPEDFEVDRTVQIELLNRSSGYFNENESFEADKFTETVLEEPALVESFNDFKQTYQQEHQVQIEDEFAVNKQAVKQQKKNFKSVLKLDKNFHIYVHGNRELIEQGFDADRQMNYYKVYYKEERL